MRKPATSTLRIIGGQWKRRHVSFLAVDGLRPTPDRVRETVFNWLQFDIQGQRCLDAFAGSGALGLEALSRGAADCLFIEKHPAQAKHLLQNLAALGKNAPVLCGDSLQILSQQQQAFDIVFLDPPYALKLWQPVTQILVERNLLTADTLVYLEADCDWPDLQLAAGWHCLKSTKAGTVQGFLARFSPNDEL